MILRILALVALAAAVASGVYGLMAGGVLISLGELWFKLSPGTLNLMQAVTQRYIAPAVWDPGIVWVLEKPAVAVFGLLALAFIVPVLLRRRG